jgi:hypothetical protein
MVDAEDKGGSGETVEKSGDCHGNDGVHPDRHPGVAGETPVVPDDTQLVAEEGAVDEKPEEDDDGGSPEERRRQGRRRQQPGELHRLRYFRCREETAGLVSQGTYEQIVEDRRDRRREEKLVMSSSAPVACRSQPESAASAAAAPAPARAAKKPGRGVVRATIVVTTAPR